MATSTIKPQAIYNSAYATVNSTYCSSGQVIYRQLQINGEAVVTVDYDITFSGSYDSNTEKPSCTVCSGLPKPKGQIHVFLSVGTATETKILAVFDDGTLRPRYAGTVSGHWYGTFTYLT